MTTVLVATVAASLMAGLLLLGRGMVGPPRSLDDALADLHRQRRVDEDEPELSSWVRLASGRPSERVSADLRVCERDTSRWAQDRLRWAALAGAVLASTLIVVPVAAGGTPPLAAAAGALFVGLGGGWVYAEIDLHRDAERARRDLRHAVAAYLELVTILMAGGAGPESAMYVAAETGRGPAFRHLRSALAAAQVRQEPPWALLGGLGRRLKVTELIELGASMSLAGGGAQVKETLATKASSIRVKDLAQIESEAQARSETMAVPVVLMFSGFLLLLGYPALAALSGP